MSADRSWIPGCDCDRGSIRTESGWRQCGCIYSRSLWVELREVALSATPMSKTFASFDVDREQAAAAVAMDWARDPWGWLIFHGDNGTGKSHLACAAIASLANAKVRAVAVSMGRVYDLLERARFDDGPNGRRLENALTSAEILCMDDLGAAKLDERVAAAVFRIVDYRASEAMPTIVTMDKDPRDLELIPGWRRIVDRMIENGAVVKMRSTSSFRWEKSKKRRDELSLRLKLGTDQKG